MDRTIGNWSSIDWHFTPTHHPGTHADIEVFLTKQALCGWLNFVRAGAVNGRSDFTRDNRESWLTLAGGPLDWPITVWTYTVKNGQISSDWIAHPAV